MVGILFQAVAIGLDVSDRDHHDQLAAARHLVACGQGALTQEVEFVLVQAALQTQQESVITLARRVDGLLIDEQGVDNTAHLDQLLPVPTVAGEARHLERRHRSDFAKADVGHHPFEAGPRHHSGRGAPKVLIDNLNFRPSQGAQPILHGVLQRAALAVVGNLVR